MAIFITGTDTNIGKTLFSMGFMLKYSEKLGFSYLKPFQSGDKDENDTEKIRALVKSKNTVLDPYYSFTYPASPYYAATLEKTKIDMERVEKDLLEKRNEKILFEGAGGVFVPLGEKILYIDLIQKLNIPTILVCRTGLGTINHTLLTMEALRNRGLGILGFYSFGKLDALAMDNMIYIERYSGIKHIGSMEIPEEFITGSLNDHISENFELPEDILNQLK